MCMNYHNILHDDIRNGVGLRVTLFVSGCSHRCKGCQNKQTWDFNSGIEFDKNAYEEIINELNKDYIDGITFSGGDPFCKENIEDISLLIHTLKTNVSKDFSIWVYTGRTYEDLLANDFYALCNIDVLVDGEYVEDLFDANYHWCGSTNQRVIDVQKSLLNGVVELYG